MAKGRLKKLAAILLCLCQPCFGYSWAYNFGTATDTTGATTATQTTTQVNGQNAAIVVQIGWLAAVTSPSLTWGGSQSLTLIETETNANGQEIALYGLVAPKGGTQTLSASWTGSTECTIQTVSFTGVNQTGGTTTFANATSNTGNSAGPATITITSTSGDAVINNIMTGFTAGLSAFTPTETYAVNCSGSCNDGGSWAPGAATVTLQASLSTTDVWGVVGCDIVAAPGQTVAVSGVSPVVQFTGSKATITGGKVTAQ